jgi:flagellin-like protein
MKKKFGNKKALSPVVAAIILIAVTVAVSIAVAAWMGSLTIGFMETAELTITDVDFTIGNPSGIITVKVTNSGTSPFTVNRIRVNGENADTWLSGTSNTVTPGSNETFTITQPIAPGTKYAVSLYDIDNTMIGAHTATA